MHAFEVHSFKRPTFCDVCNKFLWGLAKQGLLCVHCGMACHEKCVSDIFSVTATACEGAHSLRPGPGPGPLPPATGAAVEPPESLSQLSYRADFASSPSLADILDSPAPTTAGPTTATTSSTTMAATATGTAAIHAVPTATAALVSATATTPPTLLPVHTSSDASSCSSTAAATTAAAGTAALAASLPASDPAASSLPPPAELSGSATPPPTRNTSTISTILPPPSPQLSSAPSAPSLSSSPSPVTLSSLKRYFASETFLRDLERESALAALKLEEEVYEPPLNMLTTLPNTFSKFTAESGAVYTGLETVRDILYWKSISKTLAVMVVWVFLCLKPIFIPVLPAVLVLVYIISCYTARARAKYAAEVVASGGSLPTAASASAARAASGRHRPPLLVQGFYNEESSDDDEIDSGPLHDDSAPSAAATDASPTSTTTRSHHQHRHRHRIRNRLHNIRHSSDASEAHPFDPYDVFSASNVHQREQAAADAVRSPTASAAPLASPVENAHRPPAPLFSKAGVLGFLFKKDLLRNADYRHNMQRIQNSLEAHSDLYRASLAYMRVLDWTDEEVTLLVTYGLIAYIVGVVLIQFIIPFNVLMALSGVAVFLSNTVFFRAIKSILFQQLSGTTQYFRLTFGQHFYRAVPQLRPSIPTAPVPDAVCEMAFQNQRWWIAVGWSDSLFPGERPRYSDAEGRVDRTLSAVTPPAGWQWAGEWQILLDSTADAEGWQYGTSRWKDWSATPKSETYTRRRRWIRWRKPAASAGAAAAATVPAVVEEAK